MLNIFAERSTGNMLRINNQSTWRVLVLLKIFQHI